MYITRHCGQREEEHGYPHALPFPDISMDREPIMVQLARLISVIRCMNHAEVKGQEDDPGSLHVPAAHAVHEVLPLRLEYVPLKQTAQVVAPCSEYSPGAHVSQVLPLIQDPAGQGWQSSAGRPVKWKVPVGQGGL